MMIMPTRAEQLEAGFQPSAEQSVRTTAANELSTNYVENWDRVDLEAPLEPDTTFSLKIEQ